MAKGGMKFGKAKGGKLVSTPMTQKTGGYGKGKKS